MPWKSLARKAQYDADYRSRPDVKTARDKATQDWARDNKQRILDREAKRRLEKRAMCLVATTRTRARKRGLGFDLDAHIPEIQARIDDGKCELTGTPFDLSPGRKYNSPSLDRINPKAGYRYSNIRIVLNCVNAALGDWGEGVLRSVMEAWLG